MSTGIPSETPLPRRQSDIVRVTATTIGVFLLCTTILYFAGGKKVFDRLKQSEETARKVENVSAELSEAETRDKKTQSVLAAIQEKLDSPTIESDQLDELLSRLKALESGRANLQDTIRALAEQASTVDANRSRNRVQVVHAAKVGRTTEQVLAGLEDEITEWTGANAAVQNSELGRKIAAFPDLVEQYLALNDAPVVSFDDFDRWQQQLNALYPRIKQAYENDEFLVIGDDDVRLLSDLLAQVQAARTTLRKHQRSLNLILASAKEANPGQQTLREARIARQAERDAAYLRQLAASRKAAADAIDAEYAEKIAEEEREQREILAKQRLRAAELETQQRQVELDRLDGAAEEAGRLRERTSLLREFERDRAAIDSLLAPFLDLAITQPAGNNPISKGGIRRQTSLSALRGSGALNDTKAGLDFLYHVGGHPANMRRKGGFPGFVSMSPIPNNAVRQTVRRAQQLLSKYGDILVEKGMLEP